MITNELELTQAQADALLRVGKIFLDKSSIVVNRPFNFRRDLQSVANQEDKFYLNVSQTSIEFSKYSTTTRFFSIPLARACISEDAIHENPDGEMIRGPHIHIYKEGYNDCFAEPLEKHGFTTTEIANFLDEFLKYCFIEKIDIVDQRILKNE